MKLPLQSKYHTELRRLERELVRIDYDDEPQFRWQLLNRLKDIIQKPNGEVSWWNVIVKLGEIIAMIVTLIRLNK